MSDSSSVRFSDRTVLVTGAGGGIGRGVSERFYAEGATVVGVDISANGLAETTEILNGGPGSFVGVHGDLSSKAGCVAAIDAAVAHGGHLDVLCNVAAINKCTKTVDMTEEEWHLMLAVNLSGPFFMAQAALPHLEASANAGRGGNMVTVASNAASQGMAYFAAYCASKGGVANLTRSLAMEYARSKVRINAVAPGGTDTPMTQDLGAAIPDGIDMDLFMRGAGWRPFTTPADIAAVIAFVASPEAVALHGAVVAADQGLTAG